MIHGFANSCKAATKGYQALIEGLRDVLWPRRPEQLAEYFGFHWPGNHPWPGLNQLTYATRVATARAAGAVLGAKLGELNPRAEVILVAHSLGCRVLLTALESLVPVPSGERARVSSALLLAAAVPVDECAFDGPGPFQDRLNGVTYAVLHSHRDRVLAVAFRPGQFLFGVPTGPAVGRRGHPMGDRWDKRVPTGLGHSGYWRSPTTARQLGRALSPFGRHLLPVLPNEVGDAHEAAREIRSLDLPERNLREHVLGLTRWARLGSLADHDHELSGTTSSSAPSSGALIQVRGVSHVFHGRRGALQALGGIDLDVARGEFVAVVGRSGCGKSTLLRIVGGLLTPTSGEVIDDGRPVVEPRSDVAMMFQRPTLLPWRSVLDNVLLPVEFFGWRRSLHRRRAMGLLEDLGIADFHKRSLRELSTGMQQRVALCRALITEPRVLLMDDPFSMLDMLTREELAGELQRIYMERSMTVLFATTSIDDAILLSDRVVLLSPRPGAVLTILKVQIPRPRTLGHSAHQSEVAQISAELRELLWLWGSP